MAETAAHLVDHVFPPLPVRQWVLSLPKRLRYFLKSKPAVVTAVLQILLRVIRQGLLKRCPDAPANARLGAVSLIHRFGDALNEHIHYHCCIIVGKQGRRCAVKTREIHPQITQMDADSEAQKNNLRKSAKSADNSFSEARETVKALKKILEKIGV